MNQDGNNEREGFPVDEYAGVSSMSRKDADILGSPLPHLSLVLRYAIKSKLCGQSVRDHPPWTSVLAGDLVSLETDGRSGVSDGWQIMGRVKLFLCTDVPPSPPSGLQLQTYLPLSAARRSRWRDRLRSSKRTDGEIGDCRERRREGCRGPAR